MPDRPIIAHCLEYSIREYGGVEVLVQKLLEALAKDFRIVLVSSDPEGSLEGTPWGALVERHFPLSMFTGSRKASEKFASSLRACGVELAHFHGATYAFGVRVFNRCAMIHVHKAGIPVVFTNHGAFTIFDYCAPYRPLWMKLASLPAVWLSKIHAVTHCEMEIAVSRNDMNNLRRWYWPVKGKFSVLYHSKLAAEEMPPSAAARKPVILYVGTIGYRKGHIFLAKAFAAIAQRHPGWRLVLAGRKGEPRFLSPILEVRDRAGLADRLLLEHELSNKAVAELMRTSAIFAMPSLYEGLGLSLQEALYRGCACVASRVGGIQDLIEDGVNGLLVPPGDADALAGALEKLIADSKLRGRFSEAARPSVLEKGMTAPQMVENYLKIYRQILDQKS
jgi:glycosyltransferase involved in cell wall biosynthesis